MSPGTPDYSLMYDMLKGDIQIGRLTLSWDLTGGKTREQVAEERRREVEGTLCLKGGRIIMPACGIY